VECVADKDDRKFFNTDQKVDPRIAAKLLEESRIIARAMPQGDILGFAPPFCLTRKEADQIVDGTVKAVKAVLG
jgi:L-2,4-diaminobutyrate transaminase